MDERRVRQTFGDAGLAWLVARVRQRLERGEPLTGAVMLRSPSDAERAATDALLGRRSSAGASVSVRLEVLDALVRSSEMCDGLVQAIECVSGPVENLRALRERDETEFVSVLEGAAQSLARVPGVAKWIELLRTTGLLRRVSRGDVTVARVLMGGCIATADKLPAPGIPLAELAASATHDSHSLDLGTPLGTLMVRLAAHMTDAEGWEDAEQRRDAWAGVGVLVDELSAPALVLNLRGDGGGPTARAMSIHADAGEPYRLSTRQLLHGAQQFSGDGVGPVVFVCENPSVVAAAARRLGARSAPLVCVEGNPRGASRILIARLRDAGVRVRYHGDFDWAGVQIGNRVIGRWRADPWRFGASDYRAAAVGKLGLGDDLPVAAVWDDELRGAMSERLVAVHEEQVVETLIADLLAERR